LRSVRAGVKQAVMLLRRISVTVDWRGIVEEGDQPSDHTLYVAVKIKVTAALTREIAVDPRKRAGIHSQTTQ
jgi:hypothetical protein